MAICFVMPLYAFSQPVRSEMSSTELCRNEKFKLYPTQNMWTFLKLDTSDGRLWQVQFAVNGERSELDLCVTPLVLDKDKPAGRFDLYPTENMYNFILIDKYVGTTYQIQWNSDPDRRMRIPIKDDWSLVWSKGYAVVRRLKEGKKESDYDHDSLADQVLYYMNTEKNYIDMSGNYLSDKWFAYADDFSQDGIAIVSAGTDKWNVIRTNGQFLYKNWYNIIYQSGWPGYFEVRKASKYNLLDKDERPLFATWYDGIFFDPHSDRYVIVKNNKKVNAIDRRGTPFSPDWYDDMVVYDDVDIAMISKNSKRNFIRRDASIIGKEWYDEVYPPADGFAVVVRDSSYNYMNLSDGSLLLSGWYDDAMPFKNGSATVKKGWRSFSVDKNGEMVLLRNEE